LVQRIFARPQRAVDDEESRATGYTSTAFYYSL